MRATNGAGIFDRILIFFSIGDHRKTINKEGIETYKASILILLIVLLKSLKTSCIFFLVSKPRNGFIWEIN